MANLLGSYEEIIGLPGDLSSELWHRMIGYYFNGASQQELEHRIEQIHVVGLARNFSWLSLSDSFPEAVIRECQEAFDERITRNKDRILEVCSTFKDWEES